MRKLVLPLPGVEEGVSYGTPAFRVRGKFFLRLREDGDLVVRIDQGERYFLMQRDPETFYITDHYRNWAGVLVRLAIVDPEELRELLQHAWRPLASKKMVEAFDHKR